jgi:hypothetical protein
MRNIYDIISEQRLMVEVNFASYDLEYTVEHFQQNDYLQEGVGESLKNAGKKVVEFIKNIINKIRTFIGKIIGYFKKSDNTEDKLNAKLQGNGKGSNNSGLSDKFKEWVRKKDTMAIHIHLKNLIAADPTFSEFDNCVKYAKEKGITIFEAHDNKMPINNNKDEWNKDYFNRQSLRLVSNFSRERINHLREVVKVVYKDRLNTNNSNNKQQVAPKKDIDKDKLLHQTNKKDIDIDKLLHQTNKKVKLHKYASLDQKNALAKSLLTSIPDVLKECANKGITDKNEFNKKLFFKVFTGEADGLGLDVPMKERIRIELNEGKDDEYGEYTVSVVADIAMEYIRGKDKAIQSLNSAYKSAETTLNKLKQQAQTEEDQKKLQLLTNATNMISSIVNEISMGIVKAFNEYNKLANTLIDEYNSGDMK